jgi:hypothetical protein
MPFKQSPLGAQLSAGKRENQNLMRQAWPEVFHESRDNVFFRACPALDAEPGKVALHLT